MTRAPKKREMVEVLVSDEQLALLRELDFPGTEEVLAKPLRDEEGWLLRTTRSHLEDIVGWVA